MKTLQLNKIIGSQICFLAALSISTIGFSLKRTLNFFDQNPPQVINDDEKPQPVSANQSASKENTPSRRDSSPTTNISIETNQDVVKTTLIKCNTYLCPYFINFNI